MPDCTQPCKSSSLQSVRVRMYRPGLGDCFLITFQEEDKNTHMLVDCGVFLGTQNGADRIREIVEDIREQTQDEIDVVVATHEHWDHLAGFIYAQDAFEAVNIHQVWLAWTEDPSNPLAQQLRDEREARISALHLALENLHEQFGDYGRGIQEVLDFFGEPFGARGRSTKDALEYISHHKTAQIKYCFPGGEALSIGGLDGVRIYVLGPPQDESLLMRSEPSTSGDEVYHEITRLNLTNSFFAMLPLGAENERYDRVRELSFPFDRGYQVSQEEAQQDLFFKEYYGFDEEAQSGESWRRIESDWLDLTGELALALDNDTNNTSLVLAIEMVDSGQVLLFPADAQVGNWLSWQEHTWNVEEAGGGVKTVVVDDLLSRTVLYKVGHHGSHNATLREQGLEKMTSEELVAMIPVDESFAQKKAWKMPFNPLLQRLVEKTRGRVIRADTGLPEEDRLSLTVAERGRFTSAAHQEDLFIDFTIQLA
jgi:glyoxylase-like metal-dependent hydrolase (beta-lactamase superfamily II)